MAVAKFASIACTGVAAIAVCVGLWAGPVVASPARLGPASGPPAPALAGTKTRPGFVDCGVYPLAVKPAGFVVSCADSNSLAKDLAWSKWGTTAATARGAFTWNVCKPYCAASKTWAKSAATFTLSDMVHTTKYGWVFEALTVHITGKKTGGFPRTMTYKEKPLP
jgi:hypothetical protein